MLLSHERDLVEHPRSRKIDTDVESVDNEGLVAVDEIKEHEQQRCLDIAADRQLKSLVASKSNSGSLDERHLPHMDLVHAGRGTDLL